MPPRSIVNWFAGIYQEVGLDGCSSHSGRRTFITRSARLLARTGGSLRDVQELAGHRSLTTTERYIEGEHDFATFKVRALRLMWRIDYYDRERRFGSPDPADPAVTSRVLTIMLAAEY